MSSRAAKENAVFEKRAERHRALLAESARIRAESSVARRGLQEAIDATGLARYVSPLLSYRD